MKVEDAKRCKCGCGTKIIGHPNKKFVNQRHKDKFHNRTNPRGYGLLRSFSRDDDDHLSDDDKRYYATVHPFSDEAHGQS